MLQVYVSNVLSILDVCCKCFIWMLHMFQWLYTYVASVYSKCFIFSYVRCKCFIWLLHMLQLLYTYAASVFANVSPISDVYCRSASCCNIAGAGSGRMQRRSPWPQQSPRARQAKWAHNCMRTRISMWGRVCRRSSCIRHAGADVKAQQLHVG